MSTGPHKFGIQISTEEYDAETESNGLACQLVFTYTQKYPDTAPLVEIENPVNFEDDYEEQLLEHIKQSVRFENFRGVVSNKKKPKCCTMFLYPLALSSEFVIICFNFILDNRKSGH